MYRRSDGRDNNTFRKLGPSLTLHRPIDDHPPNVIDASL